MKRKIIKLSAFAKQGLYALALAVFSGPAYSQTTYTFNYTGSTQTISLPPGNYSIQCWGADGGNATSSSTTTSGGKGGFSTGVFTNTSTAIFNVYVGGHGGNASGASNLGGGGGGMSDIAPASNSTLIIIAAAGGGGAAAGSSSESSTGGAGGGLTGGTALDGSGVSSGAAATGGSQSAGGSATAGSYGGGSPGGYGYGGGASNGASPSPSPSGTLHSGGGAGGNGGSGGWNGGGGGCTATTGNEHAGGGGAGYYGGGGGRGDGGAGGGGSSYIGGVTSATTIMSGQTGFVTNPDVAGHGRVLITELCSISIYAAGATNSLSPLICSGQSLTLTTNATSNYSWSTGATTSSLVVSPTSHTLYSLSATSSLNCVANAAINVSVSAAAPVLTITASSSSICLGDSVNLVASGAITYTWSGNVSNGANFAPTSSASYTVMGENGCGITTTVTTVTVSPLPINASASSTIVCALNPATLTASGATTYSWSTSQTGSAVIVGPASTTVYSVTGMSGNCIGNTVITVATNPNPTLNISATSSLVCEGDPVTITVSGADSYTWIPSTLSGTSAVVNPTAPSLYQVSGTNSLGCTSNISQIVLTNPLPTVTAVSNPTMICVGATATITAGGADSYSLNSVAAAAAVSTVNPLTSSVYTITGRFNSTGCQSTKTVALSVFQASLPVSASSSVCLGSAVTLTAGTATNYQWSNGSIFSAITVTPSSSTLYTVSATTQSNSLNCPVSNSVFVTVLPNPSVTASASRTFACRYETVDLSTSGASSYLWSSQYGQVGTGAAVTVTSAVAVTINYTVTGTDANGCMSKNNVSVQFSQCTGIDNYAAASEMRVYPNPASGSFVVEAENGGMVEIYNELGQQVRAERLDDSNQNTVTINELPAGIYLVTIRTGSQTLSQKLIVQ
jgi:hypothetical protein